jgi:hypothetical protein
VAFLNLLVSKNLQDLDLMASNLSSLGEWAVLLVLPRNGQALLTAQRLGEENTDETDKANVTLVVTLLLDLLSMGTISES